MRVARAAMLMPALMLVNMQAVIAHDGHHQHHQGSQAAADRSAAHVTLHDVQLVNTDGQAVRFKSEAVDNRIAVVGFIYTSCTTICPLTSAVFAEVQEHLANKLGERFGRDVELISLSVDPTTDTPERLKAYAVSFGTPTGWLWLTGEKTKMDKVLNGLGAYAADFTTHSGAILVGDARSGDWTRLFGVPNPSDIVDRVEQLLAARESRRASARGDKS